MRLLPWLFLLSLLSSCAWAQDSYELSYLVVRSSDGQVLYSQEADKLRVPASTLKVVTAAAALENLGADHTFATQFLSSAELTRGRLKGDLCLRGSADPELKKSDLKSMVQQLSALGLRRIKGNLIVDPGPYSFPHYGSGWAWDDAGSYYSPEISGLNLDGGLWPLDPVKQPDWMHQRSPQGRGYWLVPGREGVVYQGKSPKKLAPPRTALRSGEYLLSLLRERGITLDGKLQVGISQGQVLVTHQSRSLQDILRQALKVSDNLAMELLFRAAEKKRPNILKEANIRQVDGSGLSRYNLISAQHLVQVLQDSEALKTLLVRPGEGTLKKRFLSGATRPHILAKTGTMSNISGLTGFLFPGSEKECRFAILINGHLDTTAKRKAIEDQLVETWVQEIAWPYQLTPISP